MSDEFVRTKMLIGEDGLKKLKRVGRGVRDWRVGLFAEALRAGIGRLILVDRDTVSLSNINRQLVAAHSTLGRYKVEVMRERILDINPGAKVEVYPVFYTADNAGDFDYSSFSYIADAMDTITSKLVLIERAKAAGVPVISCMGAGNKLNPTDFEVADIYETSVCPLARVMRHELRRRGLRFKGGVFKGAAAGPSKKRGERRGEKTGAGQHFLCPFGCGADYGGRDYPRFGRSVAGAAKGKKTKK